MNNDNIIVKKQINRSPRSYNCSLCRMIMRKVAIKIEIRLKLYVILILHVGMLMYVFFWLFTSTTLGRFNDAIKYNLV